MGPYTTTSPDAGERCENEVFVRLYCLFLLLTGFLYLFYVSLIMFVLRNCLQLFFSIACAGLSWNRDEFNAHIKSAAFHKSPSIMEMKHLLGKPKYKASKFKFIV